MVGILETWRKIQICKCVVVIMGQPVRYKLKTRRRSNVQQRWAFGNRFTWQSELGNCTINIFVQESVKETIQSKAYCHLRLRASLATLYS